MIRCGALRIAGNRETRFPGSPPEQRVKTPAGFSLKRGWGFSHAAGSVRKLRRRKGAHIAGLPLDIPKS